ncbi:hypothetical protein SAMN02745116_00953 [Pilibacter termitis]|uniref:Cof subfamily of IIB subfamily of haloacid dehalogenase superfamily/HAD-superfamily hydrolase, subfamily IIB n=2 Tax=Pilibacter termitis TaxID=263852 RepID=A0A1T4M5L4_9ENTE|nr:hypothetical protein SAMN02745116_00953 [Pilibacter termitis]
MIKIVFFDIDGTLLNKQSRLEKSTEIALAKAKEKGILCGIATGRGPSTIGHLLEEYALDFAACYNGQYIYTRSGEVILSKPLDKKTLHSLAEFADEHSREITFGAADKIVGSSLLRVGNTSFVRMISPFLPRKLSGTLKTGYQNVVRKHKKANYQENPVLREPIYQVVMVSPEKEQARIEAYFPTCTITRSNPYSIDIIPRGSSKFKGIEAVCEYYGISLDETMAFGDSWNDIEMIQGVAYGVAMGNAVKELKEVADFVTTSNDRDGIARAFQQFCLIEDEEEINEVMQELCIEDISSEMKYLTQKMPKSKDEKFNKVREFHQTFDKEVLQKPKAYDPQQASFRSGFKVEEIVEFLYATSNNDQVLFEELVENLKSDVEKAKEKVLAKNEPTEDVLTDQADALIDLLYFTYGSFVLMGVDPDKLFSIVHEANMGKIWADGEAHYDPITHKILKPENWEERFAPEKKIKEELARQRENSV